MTKVSTSRVKQIFIGMLVLLFLVVLDDSCSFTSVATDREDRSDHRTFGQLYYLPYGRIHITGTLSASSKNSTGDSSNAKPSASPAPTGSPQSTDKNSGDSQDESATSQEYTITVTEELQPDRSAPYYLGQQRNFAFDDENHFVVNKKYLLTTTNVKVQDRTPDIVAQTASLVAAAFGVPGGSIPGPAASEVADALKKGTQAAMAEIMKTTSGFNEELTRQATSLFAEILPSFSAQGTKDAFAGQLSGLSNRPQISQANKDAINEVKNKIAAIVPKVPLQDVINSLGAEKYKGGLIRTSTLQAILESNHIQVTPKIYHLELSSTASTEDVIDALSSVVPEKSGEPDGPAITVESETVLLSSFYKESKKTAPPAPKPFTVVFDPELAQERGAAWQIMYACGFLLDVRPEEGPTIVAADNRVDANGQRSSVESFFAGNHISGVVYRAPETFHISITSRKDWDAHIQLNQSVILPDKERSLVADYARFAFVKRTTNIAFNDGMLVDYDQITPSPVLGFLSIPKAILQALLPIPTGKSSGTGSGGASSGSGTL